MRSVKLLAVVVLAVVLALSSAQNAFAAIVYSDSQDGEALSNGTANAATNAMSAGDSNTNIYYQAFVKFSLSGISGTVSSARLYLYLDASARDGTDYSTSPLQPPNGLGDCVVRHINDYGSLDPMDLGAASIGNDPGVLLSSSATPNIGYISIDVKAAMQDDINNGRAFSSFMIKMTTNTDNNNDWDYWLFATSESGTSSAPYIDYTLAPHVSGPVGGFMEPVNKLAVFAPYLALFGVIGAVAVVFRKRPDN